MSEYQYYEFVAIDRPLDQGGTGGLCGRAISSRAGDQCDELYQPLRMGATSKAIRVRWSRGWFDLHLYLANWGIAAADHAVCPGAFWTPKGRRSVCRSTRLGRDRTSPTIT